MHQLFFRTPTLLLLLYPLLLIKSMTYSFVIRFFSQSLIMRYRTLNNAPHRRYLTEFQKNYLYIRKFNNIKNNTKKQKKFREITACSKLQVPKIKYGYQINKTGSISKIKVTSGVFLIRGIFRTLKHLNVGRYLDPCQTYCKVFGKNFQAMIIFSGRSFVDHFQMFGRILNAPMYL